MHQVSDLYKQILRLPHRVENRLEICGRVYTRAHIVSLDVTRQIFKEEVPSVGNTPAGMITVSMLTPPEEIPIQEKMLFSSRIVSGDLESEWVQKGTFYIDTRHPAQLSTGENVQIDIVGYDRMLMAEKDYSPSGEWPRTDADVLAELCKIIGVECDEVLDRGYLISEPYEYTCRELLGYIGAMYGGNWVIDDFGKLRLLRLGSSGGASEAVIRELSVATPLSPITRVVLHRMDGTSFTAGAAGAAGRALNVDCPWATQEMAEGILQQVQGYRYQSFSAEEAVIDPALELGDQVARPGGAVIGTVYQLYTAHSNVLTADMAAPPEEEINHDFPARSTAGGTAGRAMGAARRLKKENQEAIRQASERLVADIRDVQAGLYAIASADDIKGLKEGKTTLFAQIQDENQKLQSGIDARVTSDEFGKYKEANTKVFAQIQDDLSGCVREAYLELYAVSDGKGNVKTFAELVADTVTLRTTSKEMAAALELKAETKTVEALDGRVSDIDIVTADLVTRVGDAEASLTLKATRDELSRVQDSVAKLSAAVDGCVKEAYLELYAVSDGKGNSTTFADLVADTIALKGRVDLTGILAIRGGGGITANGPIYAPNQLISGGEIACADLRATRNLYYRDALYEPTQITSTAGTFMVLGIA